MSLASCLLLVSCASGSATSTTLGEASTTTTITVASATTTLASTTTTLPPTTTTIPPTEEIISLGKSVGGRDITVIHRLDVPGAGLPDDDPNRFTVLVIGVIHGNEDAGLEIVDELRRKAADDFAADPNLARLDLWLLPAMNPDGVAADRRTNANLVDLNRNFPYEWGPIAEPGNWQFAGSGPASEPETRILMSFVEELRPDLTVWYHQDAYCIAPSNGPDGPARAEYARLTGLPLKSVTGGKYTGVAATWQRKTYVDDTAFIVELGASLAPGEAKMHAEALLAITALVP